LGTKKKIGVLSKYLTNREFSKKIDTEAIDIGNKLPIDDIGNQLALFNQCLLLQVKGQTVVIDDSCFSIKTFKEGLQMLPKATIVVSLGGGSQIEGKEKTGNCYELSELAKAAGKVVSDEEKEHTPVHHSAHTTTERR